jgi:KDO2-lipid IV(A) lauroyltransferase
VKDLLWLIQFYPLRMAARVSPERLLDLTEAMSERIYRPLRRHQQRLAAARMEHLLGASADEADALSRRFIGHAIRVAYFNLRLFADRARLFPDGSTIVGREHLDRAVAAGRGVVLFGLHRFAAPQTLLALREMGYPILTVRSRNVPATYGRLVRRWATRRQPWVLDRTFPDRVVPGDPDQILKILGRLRAGGTVWVTTDTQHAPNAVVLPFLHGNVRVSAGVLDVCRLTGCPLLSLDGRYEGSRLRIEVSAPVELRTEGTRSDWMHDNLPLVVAVMERLVVACPDQWTKWVDL